MSKILLIGENCTDIFVYGDCDRLNPEAPTPVFIETHKLQFNGMAGNVLKNLQSLGLEPEFLTNKENITKTRYIDKKSNYILLRIDGGDCLDSIKNIKNINFLIYDIVIVSDYNKGFLKEEDLKYIFENSKISFVDTKKSINTWIDSATFIKINEAEYKNPENNRDYMLSKLDKKIIVTLGENGATYKQQNFKPPYKVPVRDLVGAGDSFLASLAGHYLIYKNIEDAINFANLCAGQVVSKKGIAYPDEKL